MKNFKITAMVQNLETTENTMVDNLLEEEIEAENELEAVALYAEWFAEQSRNNGFEADVDNETNEVTVGNECYSFIAREI